ncbi:MAG TPA: endospore germination permease [Bacillales bacterium]|nr:endospore germination permease [Bacillales bacterium]
MIEKGRISNIQAAMLVITSLTIIGHLILLTVVITYSRQDSWIAAIVGAILGLAGIFAVSKLAQIFPGQSLIEILFQHFSWPGKFLGILYLGYFYIMVILATRIYVEAYKKIMIQTPEWAFVAVILLLTSFIVYLGLETLGRINQIMLPIMVLFGISLVLLTIGENKDYANLLPIFGNGILPITKGSLAIMGWFGEFAILGMILPYVQQPKKLVKTGIVATIITLIMFMGPLTGPIALFGPVEAAKMVFPSFSEVRYIMAGEVINRFDSIAILFWTVGSMVRISLFFYGLSLGIGQALRLPSYRPLVIPLAWLIGVGSLLFAKSYEEFNEFMFESYVPINLIMGSIFPILLFLIAWIFFRNKYKTKYSPNK